jgi:hypothetical protein
MIALLLTCLAAAPAEESRLADGIYFLSTSQDGVAVERADGRRILLAERASDGFGEASLASVTNDNSRYRLDLAGAGPFPTGADQRRLAVYVDGVCAGIVSHSEPDAERNMDLIAYVSGEAAAKKVARAMGITARSRRHPGHVLVARWRPKQPSHRPGEPVVLCMEIENVGQTTVRFMEGGRQRGPRDNQFAFIAHRRSGWGRAVPDTGSPENFGGLGGFRKLGPQDTFTKEVDVTKWFKFEEPDSYKITCLYQIELFESNFRLPLWNDYVVGECTVVIEASTKERKP